MRKIYLILLIIVIVLIGGFSILMLQVDKAVNPDPDYNTIYSDSYNEEKFINLKQGMTLDQIEAEIGKPFETYSPTAVHKILYSDFNVSIDHGTGVSIKDTADNISFLVLDFDSTKKVIKIFNRSYIDKNKEDSLHHNDYSQIISNFGSPKQELICNCEGSVMNYSDLKEGPYRGKHPIVKIRRLILTTDKELDRLVIDEGSPYNKYIGICNE
ncbi:hypothetical protein [Sediminitomix flava]|uniref:Uncharacterized protein n=1 Tax=Sediminitomix flava TaxID=379075 RepID=A0A315YUZ3_SEDFL|nr:hypothetical protein [Sediminitomix flava]PWJ32687.1 hypothetical protein BC781_1191 [Sediminitomix flava]